MNISTLRRDNLTGIGIFSGLQERKSTKGDKVFYTLTLSKIGSSIDITMTEADYREFDMKVQTHIIDKDTFISYTCSVESHNDARPWKKDGREGAMVTTSLGKPEMVSYEVLESDSEDF